MRSIVLLFALAFASFATDAPKFMVHWQTVEPNYASNFSYAMACGQSEPDCNTPSMGVDHYEQFATEKEAFAFVNDDFQRKLPEELSEQVFLRCLRDIARAHGIVP